MPLSEYISHQMIGTPLEAAALQLRRVKIAWDQFKTPELHEIFLESTRMRQAIDRLVHTPMNCMDIGCHLGSMLHVMKRRSPQGQHIGIEPVPYKAQWLKQKFPDLDIQQIALSDQTGEAEFFLRPKSSAYSGLRLQQAGDAEFQRFTVSCKRLDDVVPSDRAIGFIKLDAEGGELAVLRGGEQMIDRCRPSIMFTCTQSALAAFHIDPEAVYSYFSDRHYPVFTLHHWLANGSPLSYEQFVQAMHYPFQAFRFLAVPKR